MKRWARALATVLAGLGLAGAAPGLALAQSHAIVPIVIRVQRAATPASAAPSTAVTVRTASPQPGVTVSRVTVRDTTGAGRAVGLSSATPALTTVPLGTPSVLIRTERRPAPDGTGTADRTRVTVEDVSASNRAAGGPAPLTLLGTAGRGRQTLIVTSDAPIDAPIVILAP
jgi:hypothetical protein